MSFHFVWAYNQQEAVAENERLHSKLEGLEAVFIGPMHHVTAKPSIHTSRSNHHTSEEQKDPWDTFTFENSANAQQAKQIQRALFSQDNDDEEVDPASLSWKRANGQANPLRSVV